MARLCIVSERDVKHRMRRKAVGHARKVQRLKIKRLQIRIDPRRISHQKVGDGGDGLLQSFQKINRHLRHHQVPVDLGFMHVVKGAVELVEHGANRFGCSAVQRLQLALVQAGRVHAARPLDHVVGFIDQHTDTPLVVDGQRVQQGAAVKVVVVVAHHHIGPIGHFLRQVVGANAVGERHMAHGRPVKRAGFAALHGSQTRRRQPVIKTFGQRA